MSPQRRRILQPNVPVDWSIASFTLRFWIVVVLTGVAAGIGASLLMELLRVVQHLSYGYHTGLFQKAVQRASGQRRVIVMALAGLFAGVAWLLLRRIAGNSPGMSSTVWERSGEMPFWESLVNGAFQMTIVAMGATLGREGAPKEAGAAAGSQFARLGGLSRDQRRLVVACGAGAGMAAVYNVPLGGALFALEVLLGTISLPLVLPALASAGIATVVAWSTLPNQPIYTVPSYGVSTSQIVWSLLFGPIAGLAAVAYIRLIAFAKAKKPKGWLLVVSTTLVFTAIGGVAVAFPEVLGNGKGTAQFAFTNQLPLVVLGAVMILRPLATGSALRSGATGGLFTPTLTFGALLGGFLGHLWISAWPGSSPGSYAVIGATAILSAAMQAPISSIALILELTDSGEPLMVPLLIATAGAMLVSRALENRSIYSAPVEPKDEEDPKVDAKDEAMEQVKRRADASAGIPHVTKTSSSP